MVLDSRSKGGGVGKVSGTVRTVPSREKLGAGQPDLCQWICARKPIHVPEAWLSLRQVPGLAIGSAESAA